MLRLIVFLLCVVFLFATFGAQWGLIGEEKPHNRCFSSWDGSNNELVSAVKTVMQNPSSFEHVHTRLGGSEESNQRAFVMTYRGTNAFGATVTQTASAWLHIPACRVEIIRLD